MGRWRTLHLGYRWRRKALIGNHFYIGDKAVTDAGDGLDVVGRLGGVAQCLPKLVDGRCQVLVEIDKDVIRPQCLAELFTQHRLPRSPYQERQHSKRLALDLDPRPKLPQFAVAKVGLVRPEANRLLHLLRVHVSTQPGRKVGLSLAGRLSSHKPLVHKPA